MCDGAGDGGIDAAVFVKGDVAEEIEGDSWLLIQSKYGSAFSGAETIGLEARDRGRFPMLNSGSWFLG